MASSVLTAHVVGTEDVNSVHQRPEEVTAMNTTSDTRICGYCDAEVEHWNLAPIDVLPDGSDYVFEVGLYVCDDCYDGHCTKYDIQPLE